MNRSEVRGLYALVHRGDQLFGVWLFLIYVMVRVPRRRQHTYPKHTIPIIRGYIIDALVGRYSSQRWRYPSLSPVDRRKYSPPTATTPVKGTGNSGTGLRYQTEQRVSLSDSLLFAGWRRARNAGMQETWRSIRVCFDG